MREIKFKAWDKEAKKFVSGYEAFDYVCSWQNDETGSHIIIRQERYQTLQYTGLKDKNGKEIYEGDVIKMAVDEPFQRTHGKWTIKEVVYRSGMWILDYVSSESGNVLPRGYTAGAIHEIRDVDKDAYFYDDNDVQELEVIGNIYENPEFLS